MIPADPVLALYWAARQAPRDLRELWDWLGKFTDRTCPLCGTQCLRRYEVMNGRCESCRTRYLAQAWDDASCDCPGRTCSRGVHLVDGKVLRAPAKPGARLGFNVERCPCWLDWHHRQRPAGAARKAMLGEGR